MSRTWVEMPVVEKPEATGVRPKYPLDVGALIIYRGPKAYLAFEDEAARASVMEHADVRLLPPAEGFEFEQNAGIGPFETRQERRRVTRLGDLVHRLAKRAGIAECADCRRRRRRLNKVIVWGWWRTQNPS